MTLAERWYSRPKCLIKYAQKILDWYLTRQEEDEFKWTYKSKKRLIVKAEVSQGILTFTVHVRVREGDMCVWKWTKYKIYSTDDGSIPCGVHDLQINPKFAMCKMRSGKYSFKQ